ncbi:hypothetical protein, partial [Enterococcus durans]|uniref:hypothetical protein n=1 Tax=Enterococcus durans TaxID=53345 RepID=UPI0039A458F8
SLYISIKLYHDFRNYDTPSFFINKIKFTLLRNFIRTNYVKTTGKTIGKTLGRETRTKSFVLWK